MHVLSSWKKTQTCFSSKNLTSDFDFATVNQWGSAVSRRRAECQVKLLSAHWRDVFSEDCCDNPVTSPLPHCGDKAAWMSPSTNERLFSTFRPIWTLWRGVYDVTVSPPSHPLYCWLEASLSELLPTGPTAGVELDTVRRLEHSAAWFICRLWSRFWEDWHPGGHGVAFFFFLLWSNISAQSLQRLRGALYFCPKKWLIITSDEHGWFH